MMGDKNDKISLGRSEYDFSLEHPSFRESLRRKFLGTGAGLSKPEGREKIAVVYGGTSAEKKASEMNAVRICRALKNMGYKAELIDYDGMIVEHLKEYEPDCVFLCVQGKYHGDGTLQAICDHLGIPYTGSGMTAAAVINDKKICKDLCRLYGIPTPEYKSLTHREFERLSTEDIARFLEPLGYPFVAKGDTQGGSYGIELIRSPEDLGRIGGLYEYDDELLFEQFIDGRFFTVSLLEQQGRLTALPVVEGCNPKKEAMILFNRSFLVLPADISAEIKETMVEYARQLFAILGASGYARADFMLDERGIPYFLEMNAVPGMREESFFPVAAELAGISFEELVGTILQTRQRKTL